MNTSISFSLVTIWLELSLDLGEDLISLVVSCIECYSSWMRCEGWKLGCIEVWWLGVFIAPTTKRTVGEGFYRMAHRTARCAIGHCPVRQPRHSAVGFWPLELLGFLIHSAHHVSKWTIVIPLSNECAVNSSRGSDYLNTSRNGQMVVVRWRSYEKFVHVWAYRLYNLDYIWD
jgi:hypothetical protein